MSIHENFDLSVYFVIDPMHCGGRPPEDVVASAVKGGVSMIQLRNKVDTLDVVRAQALKIQGLLKNTGIPFLINDHVELAAEIGADGVHIGQGDMSPARAREILGTNAILGLTAFTPEHYQALDAAHVDYVGTGPVFPTKTDKGKPILKVCGFAEIAKQAPVPVVGIGGITPENAACVVGAGASGVAMMRAISEAACPQEAAMTFHDVVKKAKAG